MPVLEFERKFACSARQVLFVLARVDQHQSLIPKCKKSSIQTCEMAGDGTWRGAVDYLFESKKYGFSQESVCDFVLDEEDMSIKLRTCGEQDRLWDFEATYDLTDLNDGRSLLRCRFNYSKKGKGYSWVPVKLIGGRIFEKIMKSVEVRAKTVNTDALLSLADWTGQTNTRFVEKDDRVHAARMRVLETLPKASQGVEIGTYMGAFAQLILEHVEPCKLILIDPWTSAVDANKSGDWYETVDQTYMDELFEMVTRRFEQQTAAGVVQIVRDFSTNALHEIDDCSLDWAYIDGDHSYEAVCEDLRLSFAKVHGGGFIAGDDYRPGSSRWDKTVVRAMDEFAANFPVERIFADGGQILFRKL